MSADEVKEVTGVNESEEGVTVTLRVVRSFPHRNIRPVVVRGVRLSCTTEQVWCGGGGWW